MNGINFEHPLVLTIIFSIIVAALFILIITLLRKSRSLQYSSSVTDSKKRTTPKPGRREYKLSNKIECYQEELFWDQDVEAINILKSFGLDKIVKTFREKGDGLEQVLAILTEHTALERFLDVIMKVTYKPEGASWGKLRNSELRVIFTDFFTLNPDAKMLSEILKLAADFIWMKDTPANTRTETETSK